MPAKTVVLVLAGWGTDPAFPWMFFHLHPNIEPALESVNLAFFDYPAGKLKIWKNHILKRGKAPKQSPDLETELIPKVKLRLESGRIDDTGPERASVLALYEWVKKQPNRSVRSLQVFSHSETVGPILWNSWERDSFGDQLDPWDGRVRDPHDTDFRIRDFEGVNPLAGAEGKKFADAFTADAFIKLWGCNAEEIPRSYLRSYVKDSSKKGSRADKTRNQDPQLDLRSYLHHIELSFPMRMAIRLNLAVWASPVGYGSFFGPTVETNRSTDPPCPLPDAETKGAKKRYCYPVKYRGEFPPDLRKDRWWRVSWFFRNQDKGADFFRNVLKARIDATDFVEYKKSWFDAAQRIAYAAVEPEAVDSPMSLQGRIVDQLEQLKVV
jgi:hypothetical protein